MLDWTLDAFDFFLFVSVLKDVARELRRRRTIVGAAILALPIVPLWALSQSPVLLAVGAFFMHSACKAHHRSARTPTLLDHLEQAVHDADGNFRISIDVVGGACSLGLCRR